MYLQSLATRSMLDSRIAKAFFTLLIAILFTMAGPVCALPDTVTFPSKDSKTTLSAYLFKPAVPAPWPAVVMLHGRSGAYSSAAKGRYNAETLSARHRDWGEFWAARGYAALLVDSFGPRGFPAGFSAHSYDERPGEVSEQKVRPLDAYAALAYLRTRSDIAAGRIGLQGWSNGAMAVLATLGPRPPGFDLPNAQTAFRAALALYPGCRAQRNTGWLPYAPLVIMVGSRDEEVSPTVCRRVAEYVSTHGGKGVEFVWYENAEHSFDDPGQQRQAVAANRAATADAKKRADAFFARELQ